jgi:molybdenum cofactor guanylyltransferase
VNAGVVAGLVLTGGSSRRMGGDKAQIYVEGVPMVERVTRAVATVCSPVLEVGPGVSDLPSVREVLLGEGPLAALVGGVAALRRLGSRGSVLLVACDLPFLRRDALAELVGWPTETSVVPVVDGRAQPLCARWSASDLEIARTLVESGRRAMRELIEATRPTELVVGFDTVALRAEHLVDFDTPVDVLAHGAAIAPRDDDAAAPSVRSVS